jgi:hypothetical protein
VSASLVGWIFPPKLTIGAFNVQALGVKKTDSDEVMRVLAKGAPFDPRVLFHA